ncbi:MAG: hypothetical protein FJ306_12220, partial [Planctomycetes bacterium]|nr:hypothetical protein [Planctomycetota bacterium]
QTSYSNLPVEAPPPVGPQQPHGDPSPSVSVRSILGMLRRHKLLIGGVALLGTTIAWLVANQLTPVYQAQADIVIEGSADTPIINPNQAPGVADINMEAEAAKLKSEANARLSVRALNLIEHPHFNPDLAPPQQGKLKALFAPVLKLVGAGGAAPPSRLPPDEVRRRLDAMPPDQKDPFYNQIAGAWAGGLSTAIPLYSRVMSVRYRSSDPQLAALSVNQAIRTYMDQQTSDKKQDALELMRFLSTQTETARKAVVEAEGKLAEFRAANQIYDTGDASTQTKQLVELQAQLLSAEKELREKTARADNGSLPNDTTLLGELASAEKRVAELSAQLGPPGASRHAARAPAARRRAGARRSRTSSRHRQPASRARGHAHLGREAAHRGRQTRGADQAADREPGAAAHAADRTRHTQAVLPGAAVALPGGQPHRPAAAQIHGAAAERGRDAQFPRGAAQGPDRADGLRGLACAGRRGGHHHRADGFRVPLDPPARADDRRRRARHGAVPVRPPAT